MGLAMATIPKDGSNRRPRVSIKAYHWAGLTSSPWGNEEDTSITNQAYWCPMRNSLFWADAGNPEAVTGLSTHLSRAATNRSATFHDEPHLT
ncbi:hypothetical protein BD309DRAFT_987825 [Dichomitus squalens]|uniref:Uncharacterized protein n=1 Tax=Dichomitus squalens TaxID=114155 RepID=A0A4Q9MEJ8_9APHY|nr:hypothetical protein BD311DRAFT_790180 [Dichomitus squalens]TBU47690.1 hypothetical protein BD309DRAFT_987825 [Dichomitus squalens]TBU57562.1 hypothetical protein BD310DRAFT_949292 [Dichomitus squalens]